MSFYSGKNASVTWNSVARDMDKLDLSFKSEVVDTTSFTSSGYQSNLDGIYSFSATTEGPYNGSAGLTQGQLVTVTFATGGGGPSFAIPLRVAEMRISTATRNAVARYSMSMESSGTYSVTF